MKSGKHLLKSLITTVILLSFFDLRHEDVEDFECYWGNCSLIVILFLSGC